jgi:hypothetical protein
MAVASCWLIPGFEQQAALVLANSGGRNSLSQRERAGVRESAPAKFNGYSFIEPALNRHLRKL